MAARSVVESMVNSAPLARVPVLTAEKLAYWLSIGVVHSGSLNRPTFTVRPEFSSWAALLLYRENRSTRLPSSCWTVSKVETPRLGTLRLIVPVLAAALAVVPLPKVAVTVLPISSW